MFERFTDRARRVVVLAQEEARMLNHNYIGTEHILLGLIHEGEGVAAKALESLNISLEAVRQQVEEIIGQGQAAPTGHIPFTPRAKKVLELVAPRGAAARTQLHRHRAHPARAHPRRRGRRGPGAAEAGRRPQPRPSDRDPAALRLHRRQGRADARRREKVARRGRWSSTSSAGTSPSWPARPSSTRSSAARRRSSASCRCCRAGPRTTRC